MKRILAVFSFSLLLVVGCPSQPAPTNGYSTTWSWTAPTTGSCTSTCKYIVSTLEVVAGTSTCPSATGQYVPQQTLTTALSTTTWTQANTTGKSICAVVSATFAGATGQPSAQSSVVVSPPLPTAPGVPTGNPQSAELKPTVSNTEPVLLSQNIGSPSVITGSVHRR